MVDISSDVSNTIDFFINIGGGVTGTSTTVNVTIDNPVPKQLLKLVAYRIEFTANTDSTACKLLKIETPFFKGNNFISAGVNSDTTYVNRSSPGLVLYCADLAVTAETVNAEPVYLSQDIKESFQMTISGLNLANLQNVSFKCTYDVGLIA